jgi:glucosamine 6-phosphate synthetase-like amidotransferase/phosphosugar isomerase protein
MATARCTWAATPWPWGPFTSRIAYLDEGDFVAIDRTTARIFDAEGRPVTRQIRIIPQAAALVEKGNYRHFMEKEIHDQPGACQHTLSAYLDPVTGRARARAAWTSPWWTGSRSSPAARPTMPA